MTRALVSPCSFLNQLLVAQVAKGLGTAPTSVGSCSRQICLGDTAGPTGERRGSRQPRAYQQRSVSISMREQEPQCFTACTKASGKTQQSVWSQQESMGMGCSSPMTEQELDKYSLRCRTFLMM